MVEVGILPDGCTFSDVIDMMSVRLIEMLTPPFDSSADETACKSIDTLMNWMKEERGSALKPIIREVVAHFSFQSLLEQALMAEDLSQRIQITAFLRLCNELFEFQKLLLKSKFFWIESRKVISKSCLNESELKWKRLLISLMQQCCDSMKPGQVMMILKSGIVKTLLNCSHRNDDLREETEQAFQHITSQMWFAADGNKKILKKLMKLGLSTLSGDLERNAPAAFADFSERSRKKRKDADKTCRVCKISQKEKKLLCCASCESVYYCGTRCQKHDWKTQHKAECQALKSL